jgi:hypothetical protein
LCVNGPDLVVGGLFSSAGSVSAAYIAMWNEPFVPVNRTVSNDTVFSFMTQCYDATQNITVAGNGSTFVVQTDGYATFIAGQNINFLPGTRVDSGGYLFGAINPNGPYCGTAAQPATVNLHSNAEHAQTIDLQFSSLKLYPNPTPGVFCLEDMGGNVLSGFKILICNNEGKIISPEVSAGKSRIRVSLENFPDGIYFLRITSETESRWLKIVRMK